MSLYQTSIGPTRADGLTVVLLRFDEPANNDLIVPAAIKSLASLHLLGGRGLLFKGSASLPVAMALAHSVAHLYQFVACYDPKLEKYVVAISHTPDFQPGALIGNE